MASVTQTIPQFSLGMSEQPDNLKFPGQVTEIVNAIPDVTNGLYKRPGAKRIGTSPLTDVQSGGSWFHYFRDQTEGSYIGQVAPDGQVRVWRCSDGQKMNTVYGTGGQTAIQNYLQTATPENLQFLTINDSTFVCNRDVSNYTQAEIDGGGTPSGISAGNSRTVTTVGKTGTTTGRPDTHFAMVELLRTENGRQYGMDVFKTADVTVVSRATRISISNDDLAEEDGTGSCPGIGTQVFSVTAASSYSGTTTVDVKEGGSAIGNANRSTTIDGNTRNIGPPKNLIFRLNILGQQGVSPNYEAGSDGPDGQNYRCSYQREVVLLHGGEGWKEGDVVRVKMTSAKGGATGNVTNSVQQYDGDVTYDITIEEVEQVEVNATVDTNNNGDGLIRPEPTPFDAQTAVTADTIIGGIIAALPGDVDGEQIGNGIYLSSTNPFTVNIVENDLMRVMQGSVNDVQNLPNQCKHGYIVKVSNSLRSEEDDYYLKFEGQNDKDGSGSWVECAKPGIDKSLTNMPLIIQRTAIDTFTVRQYTYADRGVGDDTSNPMPSFVGKVINKVLFFRNRLAFLSGENVITSRPGTLDETSGGPDFFIETALTVSTADPVDISAASMFPSDLFDGIEINAGLLVFSTNQQFLLASDDTVFNPDTAKLRSVSTFNYNEKMAPISLGTTVAYIDNSGKFSRFNEMANTAREGEPNIIEVSKVVPTLLPKNIDLLTNSRENSIVLISKTGTDEVFGYKYFQTADKRVQAAWFKWKLNNPLTYHFIINDEYFFLDSDYYLQSIKLVQAESDPSTTINNKDFLLHVDNHTTVSNGNYEPSTRLTTFSGVSWLSSVTSPNHKLVVIDEGGTPAPTNDQGRYAECTVSGTSFTVPGNWQGVTLTIGYLYPYQVKLPTLYPTKIEGARSTADVNSSLVLHRVKLHFGKIGLYETTLERVGKDDFTQVYESPIMDIYKASRAPYLEEHIQTVPVYERNTNVDITLKSSHPAPATLRSMSWEGDYSPKYYNRV